MMNSVVPECLEPVIDTKLFDEARKTLVSLVSEVTHPPVVRNMLLDAFSRRDNLMYIRSETAVTEEGALQQTLFFEPSEVLLALLGAFQTQDWNTLIARQAP